MSGLAVVSFKTQLGDDLRRFSLDKTSSVFSTLVERIRSVYAFSVKEKLIIKYSDEDGDLITVTSDAELDEAVRSAKAGLVRLQLTRAQLTSPTPTPVVATGASPMKPAAPASPLPAAAAAPQPSAQPLPPPPLPPRPVWRPVQQPSAADDDGDDAASGPDVGGGRPDLFIRWLEAAAEDERVQRVLNQASVCQHLRSLLPTLLPQLLGNKPHLRGRLNSGRFCKRVLPRLMQALLPSAPNLCAVLASEDVNAVLVGFLPRVAAQLASFLESIEPMWRGARSQYSGPAPDVAPAARDFALQAISGVLHGAQEPLLNLIFRFARLAMPSAAESPAPFVPPPPLADSTTTPLSDQAAAVAAAAVAPEQAQSDSVQPTSIPTVSVGFGPSVHDGVSCDACGQMPVVGVRYKCMQCRDYDLCERCVGGPQHDSTHAMIRMAVPAQCSGLGSFGPAAAVVAAAAAAAVRQVGQVGTPYRPPHRRFMRCGGEGPHHSDTTPTPPAYSTHVPRTDPTAPPLEEYSGVHSGRGAKQYRVSRFVSDGTVRAGTRILSGSAFTKVWVLRNDGSLAWGPLCRIIHVGGDTLGGSAAGDSVPDAGPGTEVSVQVRLTAPIQCGRYVGYWRLVDGEGRRFGHRLCCDVLVVATAAEADPTEQ